MQMRFRSPALLLLALLPAPAFALTPYLLPESGTLGGTCDFVTGEMHFECIPLYLAYLIKVIFGMLGTFCLLQIILAGYQWMITGIPGSGSGDTSGPKARLKNALFGLGFALLSFLITDLIVSVLIGG